MPTRYLMIQGTSSSAGKSLLVTALCHIFARQGVRVAPFKAQNMSNNAAVCPDGSEIGRAQAVQAAAAGVEPTAEMNPILIKPEGDSRSQVVAKGRAWKTLSAGEYYQHKAELWEAITQALARLRSQYELIIMEGAGSPAELNLKPGDLVNMAVAQHTASPVLLVGDIDRGGIFAQLLGTLWLLPPEEQALVKGLVVNKFRGDLALFQEGVKILEEKGNLPVLGVVPYIKDLYIPEEDAVALETLPQPGAQAEGVVDIAVIHLPRISNFDDFDPLSAEPGVRLRYVDSKLSLGSPDAIILPGTKSTVADLAWLQANGLAEAIRRRSRNGSAVVGICGGYQMLGRSIRDPEHTEAQVDETQGLELLEIETVFGGKKSTHRVQAVVRNGPSWMKELAGSKLEGYEIHMGKTTPSSPWLEVLQRSGKPAHGMDGGVSKDGRVWGCYIHGIFGNSAFRRAWLESLGWAAERSSPANGFAGALTYLADQVEAAMDMQRLERIVWDG
ncbi:MAG: cobyric acid synthase [Anaerolineales bacterium]